MSKIQKIDVSKLSIEALKEWHEIYLQMEMAGDSGDCWYYNSQARKVNREYWPDPDDVRLFLEKLGLINNEAND